MKEKESYGACIDKAKNTGKVQHRMIYSRDKLVGNFEFTPKPDVFFYTEEHDVMQVVLDIGDVSFFSDQAVFRTRHNEGKVVIDMPFVLVNPCNTIRGVK